MKCWWGEWNEASNNVLMHFHIPEGRRMVVFLSTNVSQGFHVQQGQNNAFASVSVCVVGNNTSTRLAKTFTDKVQVNRFLLLATSVYFRLLACCLHPFSYKHVVLMINWCAVHQLRNNLLSSLNKTVCGVIKWPS